MIIYRFDGDTMACYCIHDTEALIELEEKAHIKNTIINDSNTTNFLSVIRHESLYAVYILTEHIEPNLNKYDNQFFEITKLMDLKEDIDSYNKYLDYPIKFKDKFYTYGICLLNKWCGFHDIKINYTITKRQSNNLSKILFEYYKKDSKLFYDKLTELNKKLLIFISVTDHCPSLDVEEMLNILDDNTEKLFKKLPENNIYLGYLISEALIDRCINNFDKNTRLYKLYKSGSRFNKQQLARSAISINYSADENNIIIPKPIKSNLMKGMNEEDCFLSAPGTRKGKTYCL